MTDKYQSCSIFRVVNLQQYVIRECALLGMFEKLCIISELDKPIQQ